MKQRNKVPNLDHIGKKPGQPPKPKYLGHLVEPPPEAFMTPGSDESREHQREALESLRDEQRPEGRRQSGSRRRVDD